VERYDAIIIGAGIGGLICGAFLAQRGYKIVIFEKEMRPGGLCSSFTNEGYTFDVAVDSIGGLKKGELLQKIFAKLGIEKKLNLIQLHPIRRNIFPDLSIDIPPDVGMYKDNLKEVFKEEEKGIDGLFSLMEKIYEQSILAIIGDKRGDVLKLRNWMEKSFQDLLDTYLKNKCLKGVLSSYCASSGLPSSQVSAMVAVNTLMHYVKGGAFRVRGGVQKLIALLVEVIENNSGKVCLGEKVKQILTERNRATGVITEKQRHATSKYVISNMDLKTLINSMVPDGVIAKNRIKHLNELEASSSFVHYIWGQTRISRRTN